MNPYIPSYFVLVAEVPVNGRRIPVRAASREAAEHAVCEFRVWQATAAEAAVPVALEAEVAVAEPIAGGGG